MSNKRAPLASVPNAVNSPFRNVVAANGKRPRTQAGETRELVYGQPPTKKQIIEISDDDVENINPKRRNVVPVAAQQKLDEPFSKRTNNGQPTAFEKKLNAAREKRPLIQQRIDQFQKPSADIESVRLWKRHYKRQFPQFVFYFESIPAELRSKSIRQLQSLGAREEKFFSNAVTHVVTTRSIPPESSSTSPDEDPKYNAAGPKMTQPSAPTHDQRRTTDLLDANLQRRTQSQSVLPSHDVDPRKPSGQRNDILLRARELGIKIWALEKMQRVFKAMLETDPDDPEPTPELHTRAATTKAIPKPAKDADLELLLRNEKIHGPADRDITVAAQDMVHLKGYYIYIHDMDEKTKPVMMREFSKVELKEDGKWPQFRLSAIGRCPFIEDPAHQKRLRQEQEREAQAAAKAEHELATQRKSRANVPQPLTEREANLRRSPRKLAMQNKAEMSKPLEPPKTIPAKRQSSAEGMPHPFGSAQQSIRGMPRMIGGEPVASGLQKSAVTSAIRSQAISSTAISSTAAGVNRRVGDSKEVSALKRKVLL